MNVRRIFAILLLTVFSFPLIALPFADSDAAVPACCRRAGKHHCSMVVGDSSSGPTLARKDCPYLPTLGALSTPVGIALPPDSDSTLAPNCTQSFLSAGRLQIAWTSPDESHPKRGPPSLSH